MLLPSQSAVIASGILESGFNCLLQMPTGSGKTWLAEYAIERVLTQGGRAIYLTPLRALATELYARWVMRFAGHQVGVFTGDYGSGGAAYPVSFRDAHILIMTPERLDLCLRTWSAHWTWIPEVSLLVVDEFHLLGERSRGARLEGTLSRIQRLNPFLQIIGLSATLGNRTELAEWLHGLEFFSNWRPVPLQWRVVRFRTPADKPTLLTREIQRNVSSGGKSLVFVQSRRRTEELSQILINTGLRVRHHHAGLTHASRADIERTFRNDDVDVLIATSTLELGLNLPVRQVILYDLQTFDGIDFSPLPVNNVWQRIGRAGRPGFDEAGEAILLVPSWQSDIPRYERGEFEPISSQLNTPTALAEQILNEVASGLARTEGQLQNVFCQSLAARQKRLPNVELVIQQMCEAQMLQHAEGEEAAGLKKYLKATRLGWIAVRHFVTPTTVLLFRNALSREWELTFFDLLLLVACSEDCQPMLPVSFEELQELANGVSKERSILLKQDSGIAMEILATKGKRLLSAIKDALIVRAWTRTGDITQIAAQFDCYPFEVEQLCECNVRLLSVLSALFEKDSIDQNNTKKAEPISIKERVQALQKMVMSGLDEETITLTLIPGIGPKRAKQLKQMDISDIEALALATASDLAAARGTTLKSAQRWIAEASAALSTRSAYSFREFDVPNADVLATWPTDIEPYRLGRALRLSVSKIGKALYQVTGGLEPHQVIMRGSVLHCDCVDFNAGNVCKHILAVRLKRDDPILKQLVQSLKQPKNGTFELDLFQLWLA